MYNPICSCNEYFDQHNITIQYKVADIVNNTAEMYDVRVLIQFSELLNEWLGNTLRPNETWGVESLSAAYPNSLIIQIQRASFDSVTYEKTILGIGKVIRLSTIAQPENRR